MTWQGPPEQRTLRTVHLGRLSPKEGKYCSFMRLKSSQDPCVFTPKKRTTWDLHFSGTERKQTHEGSTAETTHRTPTGKHIPCTLGWHSGKFCHLLTRPGFLAPGCVPQPTVVHISEPLLRVRHWFPNVITNAHGHL